ncbi:TetR/AcrR family transcriptional regulator [Siminovitchia sediminis]|uniref:TetR/AcrR family transcriptional regulator n=1 Tax=Siminovitchia sediminis TaxID=1274353 RepID=A0ABW4KG87_9BACI
MNKKQLIMEKAIELFANQGFEATSVQQITEQCGISKGAFYLSFKSKDELMLALLDHFMEQILSDIDYLVRNSEAEDLLYLFYKTMFQSIEQRTDFAKIFLKEQIQTFNEKFMESMYSYDKLFDMVILSMIEQVYGESIEQSKYDLIYCVKGFLSTYSQFLLLYHVPVDIELLSKSLAEKTNILAKYTTTPFISHEFVQMPKDFPGEKVTKEQIIAEIEEKMSEMEKSIERESLALLKQQLQNPSFSLAIVKGLMENIRNHPHCKWISYLLNRYYKF